MPERNCIPKVWRAARENIKDIFNGGGNNGHPRKPRSDDPSTAPGRVNAVDTGFYTVGAGIAITTIISLLLGRRSSKRNRCARQSAAHPPSAVAGAVAQSPAAVLPATTADRGKLFTPIHVVSCCFPWSTLCNTIRYVSRKSSCCACKWHNKNVTYSPITPVHCT